MEALKQKLGGEVGSEERGIPGQGYDKDKRAWDCWGSKALPHTSSSCPLICAEIPTLLEISHLEHTHSCCLVSAVVIEQRKP